MNTYQEIRIFFVGNTRNINFIGNLTAQTSDGFTHIFDDNVLIGTVNNSNVLWIEWVKDVSR